MKRNILYRICGTLFSLSALAACGLEPQEECLPCNGKLRYTEVHMEGAPSAAGFATPLYVFRRAAGTQDGYLFDRSYTSVADGETLRLPLTELRSSDYRFLMIAQPDGGEWLTLNTAAGTTLVTGAAWEDLRLECAAGAAAPDGYGGFTDLSGEAILRDGSIRLTLTRIAGQVLFDIFRTGGSLSQPESIVSPDTESVIDRVSRIEITYENPTTALRFDENGTLVPAAYAAEPLTRSIEPQATDFRVALPQADRGLGVYDAGLRGSLRMEGAFLLPSDSHLRIKLLFTYARLRQRPRGRPHPGMFPAASGNARPSGGRGRHGTSGGCGLLYGQPGGTALRPDHRRSGRRRCRNEFRLAVKRKIVRL